MSRVQVTGVRGLGIELADGVDATDSVRALQAEWEQRQWTSRDRAAPRPRDQRRYQAARQAGGTPAR